MALTPEEVKRMEEQADLSDRFNKAADRYVVGNNPWLRAAGREQVLRQREGDVFAAARQRRLDSQRMTALSDPGRYAPQVYRDAKEWADKGGLRQHELAVADKGIEQERVKAWGMANQGGVAAGIKAGVERDAGRAQHGYFDENGNYVPGSSVREAEATGLSREEIARINNEGRWNVADINRQSRQEVADINRQSRQEVADINRQSRQEVAGINRQSRQEVADINRQSRQEVAGINRQSRQEVAETNKQARISAAGLQQQRADQNARNLIVQDINKGAYIMSGMSPEKWKSLSPEEQQAYVNGLLPNQPTSSNSQPPARRSWRDRYGAANK